MSDWKKLHFIYLNHFKSINLVRKVSKPGFSYSYLPHSFRFLLLNLVRPSAVLGPPGTLSLDILSHNLSNFTTLPARLPPPQPPSSSHILLTACSVLPSPKALWFISSPTEASLLINELRRMSSPCFVFSPEPKKTENTTIATVWGALISGAWTWSGTLKFHSLLKGHPSTNLFCKPIFINAILNYLEDICNNNAKENTKEVMALYTYWHWPQHLLAHRGLEVVIYLFTESRTSYI